MLDSRVGLGDNWRRHGWQEKRRRIEYPRIQPHPR